MYKKYHLDYRDFVIAMQSKGYADSSIKNYSYYLMLFLKYADKPRTKVTQKSVILYMNYICGCSFNVKNQSISAIKIFFKYVLKRKIDKIIVERPRKIKHLPRIVDYKSALNKIGVICNTKHRAILELALRCALRVSEVVNIKIGDIDTQTMMILIRNSKFNKDRYVPMSEELLFVLMTYVEEYDPKDFLFNGQKSLKYSHTSCQKIFKKYIDNTKSFHACRHTGATQMLNNGVNLRVIQSILGHQSSKTCEIYTHVSNDLLQHAAL